MKLHYYSHWHVIRSGCQSAGTCIYVYVFMCLGFLQHFPRTGQRHSMLAWPNLLGICSLI